MRDRIAATVLRYMARWYDYGPVETLHGPMVRARDNVVLSVEYALREAADAIQAVHQEERDTEHKEIGP